MKKHLKLALPLLVAATMLSGCSGISQEDFLDKLFPNPWDALAVFLAFIVLLIVVFFVAYKPVKELIKKRGDYVEGQIKDADAKHAEATKLLDEANKEAKEKKIEALEIVEKAKEEANVERQAILEKAKQEKAAELNKAKEEIAQEIEKSKDEIHHEIVSVAIDASKKVLEREVNSKDNEKLIDSFLDDLTKGE